MKKTHLLLILFATIVIVPVITLHSLTQQYNADLQQRNSQQDNPKESTLAAKTVATETIDMQVTFYGWPDNDPPSANIALPGIHQSAGGVGTFEDPVTFATDPNEFPAGTKVYIPFLKKYGVMEDTCAQCISDWSSGQKYHIDIWMTSDTNSGDSVIQCENQWTKETTAVEVNPPAGREVFSGNVFDPQSKTCLQSIPATTTTVQPTQPVPTLITPTIYCVGGVGEPPCAPIGTTTPSTGGGTPGNGTPGVTGGVTPSGGASTPYPSIDPCQESTSSVMHNKKKHKKHKHGRGGGFIERFMKFLIWLIEYILRGGNVPLPTDPGNPSPCPEPTNAVEPTIVPTTGAQPTQDPTPTLFGTIPTTAPSTGTVRLGAAIEPDQLDNATFTNTLKTYKFDSLTPENAMKFGPLEPTQGQFNWDGADKIVNYAQANNMRVRGHTLVWHIEVPGWVDGLSNAEAETALKNHIQTVVTRYKGKVAQWDVVNEAFNDDGSLRDTVWKQKLGDDYIAKAFQWAHEADPNAELFYNDYGTEGIADRGGNKKAKSDAVYNMVKDFKARGIPINGVGLQTHSAGDYPGTGTEIGANIKRLTEAGVKAEITELDVINIDDQAGRYAELGTACKQNGCTGITTWGLYDGHTWLSGQNPLMFDSNFQPKPAYTSLINTLGR